jgi:hypothetical protein
MVMQTLNPFVDEKAILAQSSRQFHVVEKRIGEEHARLVKAIDELREKMLADAFNARAGLLSAIAENNANVLKLQQGNEAVMARIDELSKSFEDLKARIGDRDVDVAELKKAMDEFGASPGTAPAPSPEPAPAPEGSSPAPGLEPGPSAEPAPAEPEAQAEPASGPAAGPPADSSGNPAQPS